MRSNVFIAPIGSCSFPSRLKIAKSQPGLYNQHTANAAEDSQMKTLRPGPTTHSASPTGAPEWADGVEEEEFSPKEQPQTDAAGRGNGTAHANGEAAPAENLTASEDAQLMADIADRDPEALAKLYDRYSGILKALVIRVVHDEAEADDLLQEIFMQIWKQAKNYSRKKGQALGWIVTLTRRRAIDRLRKRQAYHRVTERLELETEHQPESWVNNRIDDDILHDDLREFLRRKINALPALQREAIDLAFFKGMSQREIAIHTSTPLGTIKTRLELGLRKLFDSVRGLRDKI
jgi:RNA polymerase sigma-70 factor, ECF subfamily